MIRRAGPTASGPRRVLTRSRGCLPCRVTAGPGIAASRCRRSGAAPQPCRARRRGRPAGAGRGRVHAARSRYGVIEVATVRATTSRRPGTARQPATRSSRPPAISSRDAKRSSPPRSRAACPSSASRKAASSIRTTCSRGSKAPTTKRSSRGPASVVQLEAQAASHRSRHRARRSRPRRVQPPAATNGSAREGAGRRTRRAGGGAKPCSRR